MSTLRDQWLSVLADGAAASRPANGASCYLPELCVIAFAGPDAGEFLQGYLTCDTQTLAANTLRPWALCNLKGRVVANGWAQLTTSGEIELILHRSLELPIAEFFKPYLMFSKTQLSSRSEQTLVFGSDDPEAPLVAGTLHLRVVTELDTAVAVYQPDVLASDWRANLIRAGIVVVSEPTAATFLPQMLGLEEIGALSFDKGCYLGQEVVARAQHRGSVKRRLRQLRWQGSEPPPGASLTSSDGHKRGTVINSAATGPQEGLALAVVAVDADYPLQERDTVLTLRG